MMSRLLTRWTRFLASLRNGDIRLIMHDWLTMPLDDRAEAIDFVSRDPQRG